MKFGEKDWVEPSVTKKAKEITEESNGLVKCGWCGYLRGPENNVRLYQNNHYSGKYGDCCIELADLASEAVDNDDS